MLFYFSLLGSILSCIFTKRLSSFFPYVAQRCDRKTDLSWFYSAFPETDKQNRRETGCQDNARGNLIYKADVGYQNTSLRFSEVCSVNVGLDF